MVSDIGFKWTINYLIGTLRLLPNYLNFLNSLIVMFGGIDDAHIRKLLYAAPKRAVQILYDKYYHSLVAVSLKLTRDLAASEDIVQEAFVLVWEKHEELSRDHAVPIRGFLIKVIKYKSIDFIRQFERIQRILTLIQNEDRDHVDQPYESRIIRKEEAMALWNTVSGFPRRERECLKLRYEEDLSPDETAARLGISRSSVERALTSARKRLLKIGKDKLDDF